MAPPRSARISNMAPRRLASGLAKIMRAKGLINYAAWPLYHGSTSGTAAAALYARDRQGPKFAFQHLIYPMIDDRTAVRKDLHPYVGEFVWTQENNYFGWRSLLGEEPGSPDVSPYAAAARAADVSGLPPTYISVGGLDLFLEENMTYADRLSRAGVPVELHMYPRAYHGFYRVTNARVTKQAEHDNREALRRFLHG